MTSAKHKRAARVALDRACAAVGGQSELARRLDVHQTTVNKWFTQADGLVPMKHIEAVERESGVSRLKLRPDVPWVVVVAEEAAE